MATTKFYVSTNICYFGDLLFPKKDIKVSFYNNDLSVNIYDQDKNTNQIYNGLVAGLTTSGGTPYNRTTLETALQDFFG